GHGGFHRHVSLVVQTWRLIIGKLNPAIKRQTGKESKELENQTSPAAMVSNSRASRRIPMMLRESVISPAITMRRASSKATFLTCRTSVGSGAAATELSPSATYR